MIVASKAGLPVNIEKTPIPPQTQTSLKTMKPSLSQHTSFDAAIEGSPAEVYATMEKDLIHQVKLCEENRLAFTRLGDVTRVKLFETWSSVSKRDLILLRELAKRGWKPSHGYLYVKYNFSFPHDAHQIGKTKVIDATNSPVYNEKFLLTINRKMRQLQRVIKRNCLKFEVRIREPLGEKKLNLKQEKWLLLET
ncbi:unnamed protein product [Gongylonema pulchrum]|uniref:C2 domain-containing protein n=1 Tax=Gongylonema pulchrum TaxID=637853 RepID=A0A183DSV2_9BILA|nr:unnamed protein product [Gongylonema pulchrum]